MRFTLSKSPRVPPFTQQAIPIVSHSSRVVQGSPQALTQHVNAYKGLQCSITDYISVGRMLYSICVRTLTLKFLTLSRSGERMRLLCTHLVLAHILLEGTLFSLNIGKIHISLTWKLNLSNVVTSRETSAELS